MGVRAIEVDLVRSPNYGHILPLALGAHMLIICPLKETQKALL